MEEASDLGGWPHWSGPTGARKWPEKYVDGGNQVKKLALSVANMAGQAPVVGRGR